MPTILLTLFVTLNGIAAPPSCRASSDQPAAVLARARHALGMDSTNNRVLRITVRDVSTQGFQSDRPYPPYLISVADTRTWLDPATGVSRDSTVAPYIPSTITLADDRGTDGFWALVEQGRALDPRLVVHAWSTTTNVTLEGRCDYRDFERIVLTRSGAYGPEHLYLDPKTGFIVKLDRVEPHYLWGQVHVEYVYTTWNLFGDVLMPFSTTRLVDGEDEVTRSVLDATSLSRDSSPPLVVPSSVAAGRIELLPFLSPSPLDTVRLGPHAFVLANRGYNEVVTLLDDTVFVLDATQSETRARADSSWIARLFPGKHPIAVVVTDLAYPHVAGVRFWVATGATIISRDRSRKMLETVVARRWPHPDKLESMRDHASLRFIPVRDSLVRPGLAIYPIDGIGSEGALMVLLQRDGVLWASDFVQGLQAPALYTAEVLAATCRVHITPSRVVAEHQKLSSWSTLTALVGSQPVANYPVTCRQRVES